MSDPVLDCQGQACPQPVLRAKECIEESNPSSFAMIVDNDAAKENVSRFAASRGYEVRAEAHNGLWRLDMARKGEAAPAPAPAASPAPAAQQGEQQIAVLITSDLVGSGDDVLGGRLMVNFVATLGEMGPELWRLVLLNNGVKLALEGSPVLEHLQALERSGVSILVCGTCLDFFGLLEKKQVGETTNMLDVVTSLQLASKVIRP